MLLAFYHFPIAHALTENTALTHPVSEWGVDIGADGFYIAIVITEKQVMSPATPELTDNKFRAQREQSI